MADLVFVSHGTDNVRAQGLIEQLVAQVVKLLPGVRVHQTFVDVQEPQINEVLEGIPAEVETVVVPVLLSAGYHTYVDIAKAVEKRNSYAAPSVATRTLGPHPKLIDLLLERLEEVSLAACDQVVLGVAGSSDERAQDDVRTVAGILQSRLGIEVTVGFCAATSPDAASAVELARQRLASATVPGRVVVANYLLAPGFFDTKLRGTGADVVTGTLAPSRLLSDIIVERYKEGLQAL